MSAIKLGRNIIVNRSLRDGEPVFYIENKSESERAYSGGLIELNDCSKLIVKITKKSNIRIIHDGNVVLQKDAKKIELPIKDKGKYRVEAYYKKMPWIFSNPIVVS